MKVLLFGKETQDLEKLMKDLSFEVVAKNLFESERPIRFETHGRRPQSRRPDVVISYGGDGTLLSSEREYPGIPKLPVRNNQFCKKCSKHQDEVVLKKLLEGRMEIKEHKKIHTNIYGKDLYALNDFVVRNDDATHTIRFKVTGEASHPERAERVEGSINNKLFIGDGVVVSTPFGSSGYFKSISQKSFNDGFGLAFNNITEKIEPIILKDNDSITFQLIRGKATLSFDNSPEISTIDEGSELLFKLSTHVAKIYEDTSLRCPNCQMIRG